jgi:hypothetical protein
VVVVPHAFAPAPGGVGPACETLAQACPSFTASPEIESPAFVAFDGETLLASFARRGILSLDKETLEPTSAVAGTGAFFVRGDMGIVVHDAPVIGADGKLAQPFAPPSPGPFNIGAVAEILDLHDPAHPSVVARTALPGIDTLEQPVSGGLTISASLTGDELDVVQLLAVPDRSQGVTRFRVDATTPGCLVQQGVASTSGPLNIPAFAESDTEIGFLVFSGSTQPFDVSLARFRLDDLSPLSAVSVGAPQGNTYITATDADIWTFIGDGHLSTFNDDGSVAASFDFGSETALLAHGPDLVVTTAGPPATLTTDVVVIAQDHTTQTVNIAGSPNSNVFGNDALIVGDTALFFVFDGGVSQLVAFDLVSLTELGRQPAQNGFLTSDNHGHAFLRQFAAGTSATPIDVTTGALGAVFTIDGRGLVDVASDGTLAAAVSVSDAFIASSTGASASFAVDVTDAVSAGDHAVLLGTSALDIAPLSSVTTLAPAGVADASIPVTAVTLPAVKGHFLYVDDSPTFEVFDIADPAAPALVGSTTLPVAGDVLKLGDVIALHTASDFFAMDVSDPAHPALGGDLHATNVVGNALADGSMLACGGGSVLTFVDATDATHPTAIAGGAIDGALVALTAGPTAWSFNASPPTLFAQAPSGISLTDVASFPLPAGTSAAVAVADGVAYVEGDTLGLVRVHDAQASDGGTLSLPAAPTVVGFAPGFIAIEIGDTTIAVVTVAPDGIDVTSFGASPFEPVRALFASDAVYFVGKNAGLLRVPLSCATP